MVTMIKAKDAVDLFRHDSLVQFFSMRYSIVNVWWDDNNRIYFDTGSTVHWLWPDDEVIVHSCNERRMYTDVYGPCGDPSHRKEFKNG